MKRPWQIWLLYLIGLAVVVPAFAWLTWKALELDRAESLARRQAEQEERISVALWRMDTLLTPLLADEAARPDFVYQAVYPADDSVNTTGSRVGGDDDSPGAKSAAGKQPAVIPRLELSPLLADPPPFVLLHFQVQADGRVTSPQCPTGEASAWAMGRGVSTAFVEQAADRLKQLQPALAYDDLLARLPPQSPAIAMASGPAGSLPPLTANANPPLLSNTYDELDQLVQQQADVQLPLQPNAPAGIQQSVGPSPHDSPSTGNQQAAQFGEQSDSAVSQSSQATQNPPAPSQSALGANADNFLSQQRSQLNAANDLPSRGQQLENYAQRAYAVQRNNLKSLPSTGRIIEGPTDRLWLGDRLILARRVQVGEQTVIQGCWLDWDRLKARLEAEVSDLLPRVELRPWAFKGPASLSEPIRLLATLPVQLVVPPPVLPAAGWTPIRVSLTVAWVCLAITAFAAALTLNGVIVLSERRGAFVSAVTHELRTPLTTFRMYAEMLAENMVPEADQRQRYLQTLKTEADRLAHLVENVLQYARLERGRDPGKRREATTLAALIERCETRLADRAAHAEMKLEVTLSAADRETVLSTDSAAVEQILFNLVDNACKYAALAADKRIHLEISTPPRVVRISVRDHGPGISPAGRKKLFRPFSKSVHEAASSAPGVGLGLALSKRLAADLGGRLEMESAADGGAMFKLTLPRAS